MVPSASARRPCAGDCRTAALCT